MKKVVGVIYIGLIFGLLCAGNLLIRIGYTSMLGIMGFACLGFGALLFLCGVLVSIWCANKKVKEREMKYQESLQEKTRYKQELKERYGVDVSDEQMKQWQES
ncbi:MAG: hypothetical protein FWD76_02610 [Firmicutes bacterium]|nr:hypothetical protein [Bacillota bacterium]